MLEDLRNTSISQANVTHKDNIDNNRNPKISFRANPNAVDTTPTADTYQQGLPKEDSKLRTAAYLIPTWYGLNKSADLFNKACGGEYDKSLVGRLGRLGDKIANSRVGNSNFVHKVGNWFDGVKVKAQAYIDKHPMLSAMQKTPTEPENSMPKAFMETQNECDIKEAISELEKFVDKTPKSLKESGATKAEIDALKKKYGTNLFGKIKNEKAAIEEFQLMKLGGGKVLADEQRLAGIIQRYEQQILAMAENDPSRGHAIQRLQKLRDSLNTYRADKLSSLKKSTVGLNLGVIRDNPVANLANVESALERASVAAPKLSRHTNKLKAISQPTTKLGKLFPKLAKLGMRGMTFGGGLINTAFIAFPLASSIKNAVDAPKEKKAGTLAEGIVDAMSWVVSMPLALIGMHSVNGIKNTGLSKDAYQNFKNELNAFNIKAKNGGFANLAEWTAEKTRIEGLKAVSGKQPWFTRAMKKVAEGLSIGLEQFRPYQEKTAHLTGSAKWSARMGNIKRWMPNAMKNVVGYPLRFALYMFAFAPVVDKMMSWCTKAIFGESYDPEKIKEEQEKLAQQQAELYPGPRLLPNPNAENGLGSVDINNLSNKNLIKQKVLGVKPEDEQTQVQQNPYQGFNAAPERMVKGEPFMPPTFPQNGTQQSPTTQINNYPKAPNSDEKINRTYMPEFDLNAPLPYRNPLEDPNESKNYYKAQAMLDRAQKTLQENQEYINNGFRSKD